MWTGNRSRTDRILAAIEIPALALWFGALCGFAFFQAPIAFRIVAPSDVAKFALLTSTNLGALANLGYLCGGIAIIVTILRSLRAADRVFDACRLLLIVVAILLVLFESQSIVPAMAQIADLHSAAYHDLHARSSLVYGVVVLMLLGALILAAIRREN